MSSINRKMANLITSTGDVATSALDNAASMQVFSSVDSLPTSSLSAGDQALVGTRLYISNGSGWYNVALINATPTLTIDPTGAVALAIDGSTPTVITLTGTDSDNADASLVYSAESDGSFGGLATLSQDSSVFTITPLSEDSATTTSSTLTFKVSDGINFGSGTTTFTLTFTVANSKYTTFLAKADTAGTDNQVDASASAHTITENGNVTSTALSPYHPGGYSTSFDGVSDYLSFTMTSAFNLTSDFTLECWFNPNALALDTQHPNIIKMGTYQLFLSSASNFVGISPDGASVTLQSANSSIALNTWYHVAVVRSGSSEAMFLNGTRVDTNTASTVYGASSGTSLIGTYSGTGGDYNGTIRDLRLVNGTAIYDPSETTISTPTKPLTAVANTSLLTCHLPYIADGSSNNHTITSFGNTSTKRFSPYDTLGYTKANHGGSVYFDGSGDNLSLSGHSDFNMGSNFTFECWCYCTAIAGGDNDLLMLVWDGSSNNSAWVSYTGSNKFEFRISYVGGWALSLTSAGTFPINQWYHVAATRNSGTAYLFINGKQEATGSNSTDISSTGNVVNIGSQGSGRHFNGYIADARIINGTAVYTSAFTPPIAPLTAITNTKLLTCTNKNDIWEQGSGSLLTKTGNTTASNTQRKFTGSSAIYLDGSGDNLTVSDLEMGSGDLTFEFWMYQDIAQSSGYRCILGTSTYASSTPFTLYTYGSNVALWLAASGGPHINAAFTATTWHHVAVVRNSGTWKLYVDGTSGGTSTTSGTYNFANTSDFRFGENLSGSYDWKGYIQDPRFTLGLARYTSNFTPPTAEFSG
jgi:hypothetical protein